MTTWVRVARSLPRRDRLRGTVAGGTDARSCGPVRAARRRGAHRGVLRIQRLPRARQPSGGGRGCPRGVGSLGYRHRGLTAHRRLPSHPPRPRVRPRRVEVDRGRARFSHGLRGQPRPADLARGAGGHDLLGRAQPRVHRRRLPSHQGPGARVRPRGPRPSVRAHVRYPGSRRRGVRLGLLHGRRHRRSGRAGAAVRSSPGAPRARRGPRRPRPRRQRPRRRDRAAARRNALQDPGLPRRVRGRFPALDRSARQSGPTLHLHHGADAG